MIKGRQMVRLLGAVMGLCLMAAGCSGPNGNWYIPSFMRPPQAPPARHYEPSAGNEINNTPAPAETQRPARVVRTRHAPAHVEQAAVPVPTPAVPAAQPLPAPTITLADAPSKEHTQRMLDDARAKLARVDRNRLGADSATTYDQANNFLAAGRKAQDESDYVAASGFARKAALLAAKLTAGAR